MTLVAKEIRASESNHWYTRDGVPRYTVTGKNGKERNTSLRDARTESLVPSVTTVLSIAAKPGLTIWLQQQAILAALTLPKRENEADAEYIDRIIHDSKEQGRSAADAGTAIHASIQDFYDSRIVKANKEHIEACDKALKETFNDWAWIAERSFAHSLGFGGKCDLHVPVNDGIVVDIKTKEFTDPNKVDFYDEHLMQLAAYRVGLGIPKARCANVFISRSSPGLAVVKEWTQADLHRGWSMFYNLLQFWQLKNKHE
jgi:hypothetical protein